jgi:diaminopimelate epimerase
MHGCGNDYVFVDCFSQSPPTHPQALAQRLSDRRRSAGGDGVVLMLPPEQPLHHGRMRMFNADGSEGSLCGNALRCMALWLHHSGHSPPNMRIEMGGRIIQAEVLEQDSDARLRGCVRITLTGPRVLRPECDCPASFVRWIEIPDVHVPGLLMPPLQADPGNPHLVLFVRSLAAVPVESLGPLLEHHSAFPDRTNVEFTEVLKPNLAQVRVWERGSGETQACGSGACAVAIAGAAVELFDRTQNIEIRMPGGPLSVLLQPDGPLLLTGPAEECCRGTIIL